MRDLLRLMFVLVLLLLFSADSQAGIIFNRGCNCRANAKFTPVATTVTTTKAVVGKTRKFTRGVFGVVLRPVKVLYGGGCANGNCQVK